MSNALSHIDCYNGPWNRAVDIGAYVGEFSIGAAEKGAQVWAYEASNGNYNALVQAIGGTVQIAAINRAVVGNGNGPWYVEGTGNIVRVRPNIQGLPANTIAFETVIRAHGPVDVLKMDIEGGEHEIFSRRDRVAQALSHVRFLQLEIHPRDGFSSTSTETVDHIAELITFLERLGFKDSPCPRRQRYPGDFCSHNHNFKG